MAKYQLLSIITYLGSRGPRGMLLFISSKTPTVRHTSGSRLLGQWSESPLSFPADGAATRAIVPHHEVLHRHVTALTDLRARTLLGAPGITSRSQIMSDLHGFGKPV